MFRLQINDRVLQYIYKQKQHMYAGMHFDAAYVSLTYRHYNTIRYIPIAQNDKRMINWLTVYILQ